MTLISRPTHRSPVHSVTSCRHLKSAGQLNECGTLKCADRPCRLDDYRGSSTCSTPLSKPVFARTALAIFFVVVVMTPHDFETPPPSFATVIDREQTADFDVVCWNNAMFVRLNDL